MILMCVFTICPGIGPLGVYVYTYSQPLYFYIFLRTLVFEHNKKAPYSPYSATRIYYNNNKNITLTT